ncbi:MAG: mechanosensitive ion channel family protein [Deltaproteobacteria bacterium]|nr:mechanosensitive ion channel [Deltaproteobacteria bacterium]MBW2078357.1 mechanosensitive ion channel [Deltaproteobacteria bacterium]MBW2311584.1 mechanosensitive ion channel [Deltaproteobacteria bacterium]RLB29187.1 MAG: mechanosensitive ion channel family protein [Deltaproteobacteria bacterium]
MERKAASSRKIYLLLVLFFIALPLSLDYLRETPAGRYLTWLNSGIGIGGTKITIINIVYLILFLVLFMFASRVIRDTLQNRVLSRTRMDIGTRSSFVNIVIYAFWILAIYTGLNILGINLSSLAFMAGALGIGIGFGLQNIINNFVSGIILLFDPSIQVGDMVQVGDDWGMVSRINIRTTVVQSFDNASLIIPNSQMLSNRITNWSFQDPKVRRQVDVGVAYGSDVHLVRDLLLQIAAEIPEVLGDPAPRVDFMDFGNSALIFRIRFWISSPEHWLTAPTEFRFRIDEEFKKHDIEIAFPQQDIHIRSASGLHDVFSKEGASPKLAHDK